MTEFIHHEVKELPDLQIKYPYEHASVLDKYVPATKEAVINSFDEYPESFHNTLENRNSFLPNKIVITHSTQHPFSSGGHSAGIHSYNLPSEAMTPEQFYSAIRQDFHKNVGETRAGKDYLLGFYNPSSSLLSRYLDDPVVSGSGKLLVPNLSKVLNDTKSRLGPLWDKFMKHHIKSGVEDFSESLPYYEDKRHEGARDYGPVIRYLFLHDSSLLPAHTRDRLHSYLKSLHNTGDLRGMGLNTLGKGDEYSYNLDNVLRQLYSQIGHKHQDIEDSRIYPKDPLLNFIKRADTGNLNRNNILGHIFDYLYPLEED